jgi:hypothetical protein
MTRNTVVPNRQALTEEQFRANWLVTLARLCRSHGDGQVSLWLGVTERHLRNLKAGLSMPTPDKIWNLLAHDETAHDELDGAYGLKNVASDSVCCADPLTLDIIALAHEVAEHEAPGSHGGKVTTDHELLLKDEGRLRRVHQILGSWLKRLDEIRGVVRLPVRGRVA